MSVLSVRVKRRCLAWGLERSGGLPGGGKASAVTWRRGVGAGGRASRQREQHVRVSEVREEKGAVCERLMGPRRGKWAVHKDQKEGKECRAEDCLPDFLGSHAV